MQGLLGGAADSPLSAQPQRTCCRMAGEDVKPNVNQGAAVSPAGQDVKPNVAEAIQLVVSTGLNASASALLIAHRVLTSRTPPSDLKG